MPTDDLGIDFDEDVEKVLAEPKSSLLKKTFDYWNKRNQKEKEIADEKKKKEEPEKLFGVF